MSGKKEERDNKYVSLTEPDYTRRLILESAVIGTTILKRWESYKRIKEKKLLYIKKFRFLMGKIHREELAFRRHFPQVGGEQRVMPRDSPGKRKVKSVHVSKAQSDLDKEIEAIKRKIEKIGTI